ncbi:MAG: AAA family ATPase [Woeseia sp.]
MFAYGEGTDPGRTMLASQVRDCLHKIVVLNPKGGCGKTTLATNLASQYALRGPAPTLIDCDPRGFAMRWLDKRPADRPAIHGVAGYENADELSRNFRLQLGPGTRTVIFDLPGSVEHVDFHSVTYDANSILIPVLPSAIDVYSASRFIAELLLVAQFDRRDRQLAVIANRTRHNTKSYQMLMRFLTSLRIPIIAVMRDSQNFVQAAAQGIGIYEMPAYKAARDIAQLDLVMNWLDQWRMRRLDSLASSRYEHVPGAEVLTPSHSKSLR